MGDQLEAQYIRIIQGALRARQDRLPGMYLALSSRLLIILTLSYKANTTQQSKAAVVSMMTADDIFTKRLAAGPVKEIEVSRHPVYRG